MGKIVGKIFKHSTGEKAETSPVMSPGPDPDAATPPSAAGSSDPPPEKIRCGLCGKEYKTEKGLADHLKREHPLDIVPGEAPGDDLSGDDLSGDALSGDDLSGDDPAEDGTAEE